MVKLVSSSLQAMQVLNLQKPVWCRQKTIFQRMAGTRLWEWLTFKAGVNQQNFLIKSRRHLLWNCLLPVVFFSTFFLPLVVQYIDPCVVCCLWLLIEKTPWAVETSCLSLLERQPEILSFHATLFFALFRIFSCEVCPKPHTSPYWSTFQLRLRPTKCRTSSWPSWTNEERECLAHHLDRKRFVIVITVCTA